MTYLTRWRLQLASRDFDRTPKGVAEIASEVGYESEAAFDGGVQAAIRCASCTLQA